MRKEADFEVTQRIKVAVASDADMTAALAAHMDYVKGETLAVDLVLADGAGDIDLNGHKAAITVEKV